MFFFKKKQQETPTIEANEPSKETEQKPNPVTTPPVMDKDNYGDQDKNEDFVNMAGKVGKAQHNYFRDIEKVKATNGSRAISREELSQHKTAQSAWLSLNGTVYDVTNYMRFHPGGKLILQGCGKQCSDLFNKYHPWVNGSFILQKYKLGYLSG